MNNEKNRLIPDLRFPEFANAEEWSIKDFGELIKLLADFTANGSFASLKENVTYFSTEEYAVLVRTTDLDKKIFIPARFTDKRGYDFLSKTSLFGNEIVMANVGSIGKVFRVPYFKKPMTLAPNTYVLKFNDFVDEDFIYQLMLRFVFEQKLLSMVGSSTLMAINKSNLRSIKVEIPTLVEQQKIASCLSSLDELITAQKEKLELLQNHKKGLMQNLFPQEGEIVPKFRFPEFENDGEWENIPLKDLSEVITKGTTPTSLGFSYVDCGVNFIKIESIIDGKINLNKAAFITNECNDVLKRSQLKENDILLSIAGALGVVTTVNKDILPANTNQALSIIRLHNENQKDYLKAFLKSNQISQEINKIKAGAAQPNISLNQVQNFRILIPKNIIEQEKIASCLSSLDELILSQTEKIEQLQSHKKGLMQGLFPKIID